MHATNRIRPITVLNDERMLNDEALNKVSILVQLFVIPVSPLISSFDIRASSFGELTCALRPLILLGSARGARFNVSSLCRALLGCRKKLQKPRWFGLNGLQFIIVINSDPISEIFSLSTVCQGTPGFTFLPGSDACCRLRKRRFR